MIEVQLNRGDKAWVHSYRNGAHAVPDENGWISILDDDGLVLGMHHKDHVIAVLIKAGEKNESAGNERRDSSGDS